MESREEQENAEDARCRVWPDGSGGEFLADSSRYRLIGLLCLDVHSIVQSMLKIDKYITWTLLF